jgi:hypothetical protein
MTRTTPIVLRKMDVTYHVRSPYVGDDGMRRAMQPMREVGTERSVAEYRLLGQAGEGLWCFSWYGETRELSLKRTAVESDVRQRGWEGLVDAPVPGREVMYWKERIVLVLRVFDDEAQAAEFSDHCYADGYTLWPWGPRRDRRVPDSSFQFDDGAGGGYQAAWFRGED